MKPGFEFERYRARGIDLTVFMQGKEHNGFLLSTDLKVWYKVNGLSLVNATINETGSTLEALRPYIKPGMTLVSNINNNLCYFMVEFVVGNKIILAKAWK